MTLMFLWVWRHGFTCREANISISSSVQSISSSRMAQRACSYSWVILTASYWNTNTFQLQSADSEYSDGRRHYFGVQIEEDVVLKAQQQPVAALNVLLHEGTRRVQPPVNPRDVRTNGRTERENLEVGRPTRRCWWLCPPATAAQTSWPAQRAAGWADTWPAGFLQTTGWWRTSACRCRRTSPSWSYCTWGLVRRST